MCVLTNERYKTYQTGFLFCRLGMPKGWDFGALRVPRGSIFFKHGHVAYQIDGDDGQNRMQVTFSSSGQTGGNRAWAEGSTAYPGLK